MLTRRQFYYLAAASVLVPASRSLWGQGGDQPYPEYDDDCGVTSGSPGVSSVVIWTRVPARFRLALPFDQTIPVRYEMATASSFAPATIVARGEIVAVATRDYTVRLRVEHLAPFATYFYRFKTATGYVSDVGRAKTLPAADADVERLRLGVVNCQKITRGYYTAYAALCREDLDFCLHLGDHIYDQDEGRAPGDDPLGGRQAKSLQDFRLKYRYYLNDPLYRQARRQFTWIDLWDDHEVYDDQAGGTERVKQPELFGGAYQAFLDYMPIDRDLDRSTLYVPAVDLFRRYSFGPLAELFVLDERQYRLENPCMRAHFTRGCDDIWHPGHTMLGLEQRAWLKSSLGASRATWKLLANEVMMAPLRISALGARRELLLHDIFGESLNRFSDYYMNLDQWDGYPAERQDLLEFIDDYKIANVVVLSGDLHAGVHGYLYRDARTIYGRPVAVELVTPAISSQTLGERAGRRVASDQVLAAIMRSNPHLVWADITSHGFTILDISKTEIKADVVAVETIHAPTSAAKVICSVKIPVGMSQLVKAR